MAEREAHILISPGEGWGLEGGGFIRLNLACRRAVLAENGAQLGPGKNVVPWKH